MQWNFEMVRRCAACVVLAGLAAAALCLPQLLPQPPAPTVPLYSAYGLRISPRLEVVKDDRLTPDVNVSDKGDRLPIRDVFKLREQYFPNCSIMDRFCRYAVWT